MDHYEIKRLNDILENYMEMINLHAPHIYFCSRCDFAKTEDDLTDVDGGDLMYCKPCLESAIASDDVDCCLECHEYHTTAFLDEKNGDLYCDRCIDGIDAESEEE
jgi:late competence protein required for DNA uptake (superfamily II DNA/RNA helicase)